MREEEITRREINKIENRIKWAKLFRYIHLWAINIYGVHKHQS